MRVPTKILLVEDEPGDVENFRRLASKHGLTAEIVVASDGVEALNMLNNDCTNNARLENKPKCPYVVIIDLSMPGMSGIELISEIRENPQLANVIIFIVTTSNLDSDIKEAYKRGISGYITKDVAGESMPNAVKMLQYYLECVVLPN